MGLSTRAIGFGWIGVRDFRTHRSIRVPQNWVKTNIVTVPGYRGIRVHKAVIDDVKRALDNAVARGAVLKLKDSGGFNPRLMRFDKKPQPSMHAFGLAVDLNIRDARVKTGVQDPILVEEFKKIGWVWGGDWRTYYDPMHFEAPLKMRVVRREDGCFVPLV